MPSWPDHVMWWHLYPLGFVGAPIRPDDGVAPLDRPVVHRLDRVEAWLDHVIALGLNGIELGPVFASETHGYDTVDHLRVDPRLGDDADLDRLIAAAHERGIRVMLDGVFNHVGRGHPAFRAVEERGPDADTAGLFRLAEGWAEGWRPGDRVPVASFEGHDSLVGLDHDAQQTADLVVEVMSHWLDRGIDAWRLDAAYAVPPAFWARVLPRVRERHPEAFFEGEVIHGDQVAFVAASSVDSLTQYELWQGIWHGLADRNLFETAHAVRRHDALLATFVPSTFVGNHDVTRIASAVGPELVPHALAILFAVAGIPAVYAGDELGWQGVKEERLGGDDAVRPEFPPAPPADGELDDEQLRILDAHRRLIAIRRERPWLHRAHTDVIENTNTAMVLRTGTGEGALVVALNLADEPADTAAADAATLLAGEAELRGGRLALPPRGWAVYAS